MHTPLTLGALFFGLVGTSTSSLTSDGIEARQSSLHLFAVNWNNQKLGSIFVNGIGTTIVDPTITPSQSFSIDPTTSFLLVSIPGSPHAFIDFQNSGTTCGSSGPLIFTSSDSNKCSQQPKWEEESDGEMVVTSVIGSFEMCGDRIFFGNPANTAGCSTVKIVTQNWTA